MKVSIIIPVFNAERFLPECKDSILAQSFHDFELILVDDGSNDESGKICDDYATKNSRIYVIHQPNGGVTTARSNGVKNANGEWITFVDADDTLPVVSLQTLIEKTSDNTDIVIARYKKERARLLFDLYPQMREGYSLISKVRDIFKRKLTMKQAEERLHEWYKGVNTCTLREIKAARECIKSRENEVLNYFLNRSTNASAELLNSKMKGFRAQLHGIADIPFFIYRICTIFG